MGWRDIKWSTKTKARAGWFSQALSASVSRRGVRVGAHSRSLRIPLGPLGPLTINFTLRRWSWNHPGPGAIQGKFGDEP